MGVDITTDATDLAKAVEGLIELQARLEAKIPKEVDAQVTKMLRHIKTEIRRQDLYDTGELFASFHKDNTGTGVWHIYSTADHSMPIEEGVPNEHRITASFPPQALAFEPENPGDWDEHYDEKSGMVYIDTVMHPGNDAYHYVLNAQATWQATVQSDLANAIAEEIVAAGFRPSTT